MELPLLFDRHAGRRRTTETHLDRPSGIAPGKKQLARSDPYTLALHEILLGMPYNSAAEFLTRYAPEPPDPRFGAACIHQTIQVAERATALGAPPGRLLQDDRHVGAVFEDEQGGIVVLDPYLLHREPVRFPAHEVARGRSAVDVPALPTRRGADGEERAGRLSARYKAVDDGYLVRLSYSRYSPARDQYVLSRHFTLRSKSTFDLTDFTRDLPALLTDPEQTSLSVRAVRPDLSGTIEAILPLEEFAGRQFTAADLWLRASDGRLARSRTGDAEPLWDALESAVSATRAEITDHILAAARVYQALADPGTRLEPYRLEDN
ncbi:hypothetical protein GCM10027059_49510 [Myceligenerans halotolerans]